MTSLSNSRSLRAWVLGWGALGCLVSLNPTAHAQIPAVQVRKVTGLNAESRVAIQAETAYAFSKNQNGLPTEIITYNDETNEELFIQYTSTDCTIEPGYSLLGWAFRNVTSFGPEQQFTRQRLQVPTSGVFNFPFDLGVAALFGDPGIASSSLGAPGVVFISNLAIPNRKFPTTGVHQCSDSGCEPLGGACVARSLDGGKTFSIADCFGEASPPGPHTSNCPAEVDPANGHFYDGTSMAVFDLPGADAAWVGFRDVDTSREAIWKMVDIRADPPNHFEKERTRLGALGELGTLGDIDIHVRLRTDPNGHLWKMSWDGASRLIANIHDHNTAPAFIGENVNQGDVAALPTPIRVGPQFAFDVGQNEAGLDEVRFVYVRTDPGPNGTSLSYIQGGSCPVDDPQLCQPQPEWVSPATSMHIQFHPTIKFGRDPFSNRNVWKVSFRQLGPDRSHATVFAGEFAARFDTGTPVIVPFAPVQVTPLEPVCTSGRGYWGDYDDMAFDPSSGTFARGYTDSTVAQCAPITDRALPMNVSTVEIAGDMANIGYGGGFEKVDSSAGCGALSIKNAITNDVTCPTGYGEQFTGRILAPEDGGDNPCGANQFACMRPDQEGEPPGVHFGGMFQVMDPNTGSGFVTNGSVVNPVTGTLGCPIGYVARQVGRVQEPLNDFGANQFACEANSVGPLEIRWRYGGTFQIDQCGTGNTANPLTHTQACPAGYVSAQYGRTKYPEDQCEIEQLVCVLEQDPLPLDFSFGGFSALVDISEGCVAGPFPQGPCPSGYTNPTFGRVIGIGEPACGWNQQFCTKPGTDPGGMQFGGAFQVNNSALSLGNELAQDPTSVGQLPPASCPAGYDDVPYAQVTDPDVPADFDAGATQHYCKAAAGAAVADHWEFGGAYQVPDCSNPGNDGAHENPITGTLGCPSGYTASKYGRVKHPELSGGCGSTQYFCYRRL